MGWKANTFTENAVALHRIENTTHTIRIVIFGRLRAVPGDATDAPNPQEWAELV